MRMLISLFWAQKPMWLTPVIHDLSKKCFQILKIPHENNTHKKFRWKISTIRHSTLARHLMKSLWSHGTLASCILGNVFSWSKKDTLWLLRVRVLLSDEVELIDNGVLGFSAPYSCDRETIPPVCVRARLFADKVTELHDCGFDVDLSSPPWSVISMSRFIKWSFATEFEWLKLCSTPEHESSNLIDVDVILAVDSLAVFVLLISVLTNTLNEWFSASLCCVSRPLLLHSLNTGSQGVGAGWWWYHQVVPPVVPPFRFSRKKFQVFHLKKSENKQNIHF